MLRPRLIPTLLLSKSGLVKTSRFKNPVYIGDPLNTIRIFNEKRVDEIILLDIDASRSNLDPNYDLISAISKECRSPLTYGGGISAVEQVERIVELGVEKVAIGSSILNLNLIQDAATMVGSQSVVGLLNIKRNTLSRKLSLVTHGTRRHNLNLQNLIEDLHGAGCGEIVANFVDREGTRSGYDIDLVNQLYSASRVPLTVIGGASSLEDITHLYQLFPYIGAGAGSIFVFKGKYNAVLIQYPVPSDKVRLYPDQI